MSPAFGVHVFDLMRDSASHSDVFSILATHGIPTGYLLRCVSSHSVAR